MSSHVLACPLIPVRANGNGKGCPGRRHQARVQRTPHVLWVSSRMSSGRTPHVLWVSSRMSLASFILASASFKIAACPRENRACPSCPFIRSFLLIYARFALENSLSMSFGRNLENRKIWWGFSRLQATCAEVRNLCLCRSGSWQVTDHRAWFGPICPQQSPFYPKQKVCAP